MQQYIHQTPSGYRPIFVNRRAGYLYASVPKAACSSIRQAIAVSLGLWPQVGEVETNPLRRTMEPYTVTSEQAAKMTDLTRWSIVRHPETRLESYWVDKLQPNGDDDRFEMVGVSFAEFVEQACRQEPSTMDVHYAPQAKILAHEGTPIVDVVYQLERIDEMWPTLQERWGLPELPVVNKSSRPKPTREWTPELRTLVRQRYADDYTLGGYE